MLIGIVCNWKGVKEENYLYTLDEMAKYDFELLKDCLNNSNAFNDSLKSESADKTWMGRLLKTDEEIKDFVSNSNKERKPEASFLYFFKPLLSFPTSTLCDFLLIITSALSFNCNDYNFT